MNTDRQIVPHIAELMGGAPPPSLNTAPGSSIRVFGNLNINYFTAEALQRTRWEIARSLLSGKFKRDFEQSAEYPNSAIQAKLTQRLAKLYGVEPAEIALTAGADEAIRALSELFCGQGGRVLTHSPTYWSYTKFAKRFQGAALDVPLKDLGHDYELDVGGIIDAINVSQGDLKLVYLSNPNNPTGTYFDENHIHDILKASKAKNIPVVVDEAYIEIAGKPSILKDRPDYPNLIVLRTLSKAYGIAGERVGAIICQDPKVIKALSYVSPMFSVTSSALNNALRVTEPSRQEAVQHSWDEVARHREIIREAVNDTNAIFAYPSAANLILMRVENASKALDAFVKRGILPANPALFGFTDRIRMSLGRPKDTDYIAQALQEIAFEMAA